MTTTDFKMKNKGNDIAVGPSLELIALWPVKHVRQHSYRCDTLSTQNMVIRDLCVLLKADSSQFTSVRISSSDQERIKNESSIIFSILKTSQGMMQETQLKKFMLMSIIFLKEMRMVIIDITVMNNMLTSILMPKRIRTGTLLFTNQLFR